jgi:hypothetical protein
MCAVGKKFFEPSFGFRHGIRPRYAADVEADRLGVRDQFAFDGGCVCQKSRSA